MNELQKTLFLDFDGTLVDSLPALKQAYFDFLADNNTAGSDREFAELNGPTVLEIVQQLKAKYSLKKSVEELYQSYLSSLTILYKNLILPVPGAQSILELAHKDNNIRIIIVSSAPLKIVQTYCETQNWTNYLCEIVCAENVTRSKPHPEIYFTALMKAGAQIDYALALEDSINGIISASAAGIPVIAVVSNKDQSGIFIESGAKAVVHNLSEVVNLDLFKQFLSNNFCSSDDHSI